MQRKMAADDDVMAILHQNVVYPNVRFFTRDNFAAIPLAEGLSPQA